MPADLRHTGEKVTTKTPLSAAGDIRIGRATFGTGKAMPRSDARAFGATSAFSIRASGDPMARAMRNPDRKRRPVTTRFLTPAELAARRAA